MAQTVQWQKLSQLIRQQLNSEYKKTSENKISGVFLLHFLRNEVILSDFPFLGLSSLCKKERKNFSWRVYFALKFPSFPSILQRWEGTQRCYLKRYGKPRRAAKRRSWSWWRDFSRRSGRMPGS